MPPSAPLFWVLHFERGPDLQRRRALAAFDAARFGLAPTGRPEFSAVDVTETFLPAPVAEELHRCCP